MNGAEWKRAGHGAGPQAWEAKRSLGVAPEKEERKEPNGEPIQERAPKDSFSPKVRTAGHHGMKVAALHPHHFSARILATRAAAAPRRIQFEWLVLSFEG